MPKRARTLDPNKPIPKVSQIMAASSATGLSMRQILLRDVTSGSILRAAARDELPLPESQTDRTYISQNWHLFDYSPWSIEDIDKV